jgi:hypothetical protein
MTGLMATGPLKVPLSLCIPLVASVMFLLVNPSNLTCIIARFLLYAHNYDIHLRSYSKISNFDELMVGCIAGSKVCLACTDDRGRVIHYDSDVTDERGEFDMIVSKYINGKQLKEKKCSVRLVSSPDPSCNILTDFAGGKSGVKLKRPTSVYRDTVKYMLTPFYFTSPMCDEPDTTDQYDDTQGNNY